eukprot:Seg2080.4 transcript_id=Seg2080.4/GoldUCD/mRNA.D3Y31 product="Sentrin-specific protease 8" protein_id=Seg2080.4/GoldUCD/D3Y31
MGNQVSELDAMAGQGKIVLSYGDCLLRESDLRLLDKGGWINDKIIGFAFEYFSTEKFKLISKDICFIAPEVSQFLKLTQGNNKEELEIFLEPLKLAEKRFIIVPVNDSTSVDSPGGSHWSTLVFSKEHGKLVHLDSFGGYNSKHAIALQMKIGSHLKPFKETSMIKVNCPQQQNYSDCGIYAICFAEEVCTLISNNNCDIFDVKFDESHISRTRERLKNIILLLSKG